MITGDDESWLWALAWGAIFGGIVGLVIGLASKEGTRTNTFIGDLRDTRHARQERQRETVEEDERPAATRRVERRERVSA